MGNARVFFRFCGNNRREQCGDRESVCLRKLVFNCTSASKKEGIHLPIYLRCREQLPIFGGVGERLLSITPHVDLFHAVADLLLFQKEPHLARCTRARTCENSRARMHTHTRTHGFLCLVMEVARLEDTFWQYGHHAALSRYSLTRTSLSSSAPNSRSRARALCVPQALVHSSSIEQGAGMQHGYTVC